MDSPRTFGTPSCLTLSWAFLRFAPFRCTAERFSPKSDVKISARVSRLCYRPIAPELGQILRPVPRLADYATVFRNTRTRSQRCLRAWSETLADSSICLHRRNGRGHPRAGETSDI